MKELKSKKTGKISIVSDEEYEQVKNHRIMSRFTVTDLKLKPLIPTLKEIKPDLEVKKKIKKNEG